MSNCVGKTCTSLSDCLVASKKIYELDEHAEINLTSRERQLLLLLASDDTISRKAGDRLAKKVSVKALLNAGLLEQSNGCINFDNLLKTYSKSNPNQNSQTKQPANTDNSKAMEDEYRALYKKMSQKLEDIYDRQGQVNQADNAETNLDSEQECCSKTQDSQKSSTQAVSQDTSQQNTASDKDVPPPASDPKDDDYLDPIVFLAANAS